MRGERTSIRTYGGFHRRNACSVNMTACGAGMIRRTLSWDPGTNCSRVREWAANHLAVSARPAGQSHVASDMNHLSASESRWGCISSRSALIQCTRVLYEQLQTNSPSAHYGHICAHFGARFCDSPLLLGMLFVVVTLICHSKLQRKGMSSAYISTIRFLPLTVVLSSRQMGGLFNLNWDKPPMTTHYYPSPELTQN